MALLFAKATSAARRVPLWVILRLPLGDRPRHPLRRLAHRQDDGHAPDQLKPIGGFCAETGGAMMLFGTALGVPVSTTHTITGAIVGVGGHPAAGVRWGVARNRLGLDPDHPLAGLIAAALYFGLRALGVCATLIDRCARRRGERDDGGEAPALASQAAEGLLALFEAVDGEAELALGQRLERSPCGGSPAARAQDPRRPRRAPRRS